MTTDLPNKNRKHFLRNYSNILEGNSCNVFCAEIYTETSTNNTVGLKTLDLSSSIQNFNETPSIGLDTKKSLVSQEDFLSRNSMAKQMCLLHSYTHNDNNYVKKWCQKYITNFVKKSRLYIVYRF